MIPVFETCQIIPAKIKLARSESLFLDLKWSLICVASTCKASCGGDFPLQVSRRSIHTTSKNREVGCQCKNSDHYTDNRRSHKNFTPNREQAWGGGKFTIIRRLIGITGMCSYLLELELSGRKKKVREGNSPPSRWRSICTELLAWWWMGCWRDLRNCTIFKWRFVVTAVIMGAGLLELHARNFFIVHNCSSWMHGHHTSST